MREVIVTENPNHLKGEISFEERQKQLDEQTAREELEQKKMRNSPYNEFAQFNIESAINVNIMYDLAKSPAASQLFWFITKNMDGYNALIASYKVFEEALNLSESTVMRGIKKLKEMGILHIKKSGSTNVYMLNPKVVWKSWGNNMKYCKFPANIILAESEQYPDAREIFEKQMHRVVNARDSKEN